MHEPLLSTSDEAHPKLTSDEIIVHSPHESEDDDDDNEHPDQFITSTSQKIEKDEYQIQQRPINESSEPIEHQDHYQQPSTAQQVPFVFHQEIEKERSKAEDHSEFERKSSTEEIITESSQFSEHEEEPEDQHRDDVITETQQEVEESELEQQHTTDQIVVESAQNIKHEDDQHELRSSIQEIPSTSHKEIEKKTEAAGEYKFEQKLSSGKVSIQSPRLSEHEEEEEEEDQYKAKEYQSERKISPDQITIESIGAAEQDHYEPLLSSKQLLIEAPEEITQHRDEQEDQYESERKLSTDNISLKSDHDSEYEEEKEQYQSEQKRSTDQVVAELSQKTKQQEDEYKRHSSTQDFSEEKPKEEDEYQVERQLSSEKVHTRSPRLSERNDVEEDQYQQQLSTSQTSVQSCQKTEEQPLNEVDDDDDVIMGVPQDIEVGQHRDEDTVQTVQKIEENTHKVEDDHKAEQKLSEDKIHLESPQVSDKEDEEKFQYEKQLSTEHITTEPHSIITTHEGQQHRDDGPYQTPQKSEEDQPKSLQLSEDEEEIQQQQHDTISVGTPQKVEEDKTERKEEKASEQKLSNVKFVVASAPSSSEEEKELQEYEQELNIESSEKVDEESKEKHEREDFANTFEQKYHEQQYKFEQDQQEKAPLKFTSESSDENYEDKPERRISTDEVIVKSPHESEHEEEEDQSPEQYQPEYKQSSDQLVTESSQTIEPDQYERSSAFQEVPITSRKEIEEQRFEDEDKENHYDQVLTGFDQQIEEEKPELEDEHKLERKSSADQVVAESFHESEHEEEDDEHRSEVISTTRLSDEEEQYQPERKRSTDHIITGTSSKIEPEHNERPSTSEQVPSTFREETETEHEYKLERKMSSGKPNIDSPQPSDHANEEFQYPSEREHGSTDQFTVEPSDTFEAEQTTVKTHEEVVDHKDEPKLERQLSTDKTNTESRDESEHEDEQEHHYEAGQKSDVEK